MTQRNAINDDELIDEVEEATEGQISRVVTLAQQQMEIQAAIFDLEQKLAAQNELLKMNMEDELPKAMSEAGIEEWTLKGGIKVKVSKVVAASIPKDRKEEALEYMMKQAPDLVKHTVHIEFGMQDSAFFKKFVRDLAQRKKPVNAEIADNIHRATLDKYVRQCEQQNISLREDLLGVFRKNVAKVKMPTGDRDAI